MVFCGSIDPPFDRKIKSVIDPLVLSRNQEENDRMKRILRKRFVSQIVLYEFKTRRVGKRYNILRFIVTVGSMVLPTLQTIQSDPKVADIEDIIFWAAIGTSLTVMIANGVIQMFGFDKKYTIYHLALEKMKTVGWQWLERSGNYAKNLDGTNASYADNWAQFWNDLERVKTITIGSVYGGDDPGDNVPPTQDKENDTDDDSTNHHQPDQNSGGTTFANNAIQQVMHVPHNTPTDTGRLLSEQPSVALQVLDTDSSMHEEIEKHWKLAFDEIPESTVVSDSATPLLNQPLDTINTGLPTFAKTEENPDHE